MSHDYFDAAHPLPLRCRLFHVHSGIGRIAIDELGRHWAITKWECSCGRTFTACARNDIDHYPLLGDVIAGVVAGRLRDHDVRCQRSTFYVRTPGGWIYDPYR